MGEMTKHFRWGKVTGEPQVVGERVIRLQAQAVLLNTPFGGFVWNRPTAVLVEKEGQVDKLPIIDATCYALIGLGGLGVLGVMGMILLRLLTAALKH